MKKPGIDPSTLYEWKRISENAKNNPDEFINMTMEAFPILLNEIDRLEGELQTVTERFIEHGHHSHGLGQVDGWNTALDKAIEFVRSRKVSASDFYAEELQKMKFKGE